MPSPAPRLVFEPRKFRVLLPKSAPGKSFIVRQLRRFEWMTVQSLSLPRHELEMLLLRIALVSPDVALVEQLDAGVASTLASVILRVSYLDSEQSTAAIHQWAERQFDSLDLRLELVACTVLNGVSLERLWSMPPEDWYLHVHAGVHAATLAGVPLSEYLQGGLKALVEAIQKLRSGAVGSSSPPSAPSPAPGVVEEYSFQWRKGSEPVIRGGVR